MISGDIQTVGIISPGDMGHAIGRAFRQHDVQIIACLNGRSERTRILAHEAGFREVDDLSQLVHEADAILSILVPAHAERAARDVARAMQDSDATTHYVDCNAVSPTTVQRIAQTIQSAGGRFSDASIIGLPPGTSTPPRLYVSGPDADSLRALDQKGIEVKTLGDEIGRASAIKMCYAAMTKGTFALHYALTCVAHRMNTLEELLSEFEHSQAAALENMRRSLPRLPAKSRRWIGEMEEIAATFADAGIGSHFFVGAAEMYRILSESEFGSETPETIDSSRTLEETIAGIANQLDQHS